MMYCRNNKANVFVLGELSDRKPVMLPVVITVVTNAWQVFHFGKLES